jgi:thiol-disulfide isomerase/thioredoxin
MKPLLVSAFVCLTALNIFADPFSDLSFEAASKQAAQTGKIVLVDFYTTWCGPCKMLDKNTWIDADVIKLLEQKTVALRIDAEKETKLAERYKIEAYPSVLLIKPDGTELDRLVGYRDAKTFMADFNATLGGKDSLARAQEKLTAAGTNDPMARMSYAKVLAQKGRDAEALDEYLWCFDHGNEVDPSFVGVRLSFLLADINALAAHFPAARKALESRRDERQAKLQAGSSDYTIAMDLVSLNGALGQKDKNLAVFDHLPHGSFARNAISQMIIDQLLEARRYADILGDKDGKSAFAKQVSQFNETLNRFPKDNPMRGQMEESLRHNTISSGAHSFEALAGLNRNDEGRDLAQQILKFDSSPATRATLAEAANRAGNTVLAQFIKQ